MEHTDRLLQLILARAPSLVDMRSGSASSFESVADSVCLVDEHSGHRTGSREGGGVTGVAGGSANRIQPAAAVKWTEDHDAQLRHCILLTHMG